MALGLGINIEFTPEIRARMPGELRDIAISIVDCGQPSTKDPVALARLFLEQFWPLYEDFERGEDLTRLVGPLLGHAGKVVEIQVSGEAPWRGLVQGLGPQGELLVRWEGEPRADPPAGSSWQDPEARLLAVRRGHVTHCCGESFQSG
jgi:biotin-(acetyl-CoA carboxylase) ligase